LKDDDDDDDDDDDLRDKGWEGVHWLTVGSVASCCEHGNEPSGSIKAGEFLG